MPGKAAILRELDKRCNEFAPPGEELLAAFGAVRRGEWIRRKLSTPLFVLLTAHHVTFVRTTWLSEDPIQTLAVIPLSRIRFTLPIPYGRGFFVSAFTQDAAGRVEEWRLKSSSAWFSEAIAIVRAANLTPGGPPYPLSGSSCSVRQEPSDAPPTDEPEDSPPQDRPRL